MIIPNYGGIYGRMQRYFDLENLKLHNTAIMSPKAMKGLVSGMDAAEAISFPFGRMSPWLVHFDKKMPAVLSRAAIQCVNLMGLLQPIDLKYVCPILVLQIRRG